MANEQGSALGWKPGLLPWIVAFRHTTNGGASVSLLEQSVYVGENPVFRLMPAVHGTCSQSHAPRNWSVNWVVNFI